MDNKEVVINRDNFLEVLLPKEDRCSPEAIREMLPTVAVDPLYVSVTQYLTEQEKAVQVEREQSPKNYVGALPLMLGKTLHINTSKIFLEEIKDITVSTAIILSVVAGHVTGDPRTSRGFDRLDPCDFTICYPVENSTWRDLWC